MKELEFDLRRPKQLLLLPGLMAPVQSLFPLVRYLHQSQKEYGITAIPLRLSVSGFDSIVERAKTIITKKLLQKSQPKIIILFGHSHGGRVACELVRRLKEISPTTEYIVVTAGSPMGKKLNYLSWLHKIFFNLSKAYRNWPHITQPSTTVVSKYLGYYSTDDRTVIPEFAKVDYMGELIELQGFSHHDLVSPTKMGPILLELLRNLNN
jgi:triacylglycerol esterase/lipase EstA (alpha/beta hydrolase family)